MMTIMSIIVDIQPDVGLAVTAPAGAACRLLAFREDFLLVRQLVVVRHRGVLRTGRGQALAGVRARQQQHRVGEEPTNFALPSSSSFRMYSLRSSAVALPPEPSR